MNAANKLTALVLCLLLLHGCAAPVIIAGGTAAGAAADPRTADSLVEDQNIELKISKAIYTNEQLKKRVHVNVTSYNGVVLLVGETPNANMRNAVVNLARHVEKVRRIHNEIIVAPPIPQLARNQDAWITTKLKTRLIATKGINSFNIKVTTSNKVVYLMGLTTKGEGNIAADVARNISGVQQVVKLFEYR